jgi:hypothetical protein
MSRAMERFLRGVVSQNEYFFEGWIPNWWKNQTQVLVSSSENTIQDAIKGFDACKSSACREANYSRDHKIIKRQGP